MSHALALHEAPPRIAAGAAASLRPAEAATAGLEVQWAAHQDEVREAQRLRWRVFVDEMGARPDLVPGAPPFHEIDRYDTHCEHLLVRCVGGPRAGLVVGTYRVLTPAAARRAGGFYSESEFDLAPVRSLCTRAVELGRSCVHPEWRSGSVVLALWTGLGQFMLRHRLDTMIGCASVGIADGGRLASGLWRQLRATHLVAPQWQVQPRQPYPIGEDDGARQEVEAPALIKGYLRCGAKVLGAPAWDRAFNTADLPMMMRVAELPPRYRRHFLGDV